MKKIACILDACTVINLIHIDDDNELLISSLSSLDIYISEKVFKEVNQNVYDKIEKLRKNEKPRVIDIKLIKKAIDQKLSVFRGNQVLDDEIEKDFGKNYFSQIKDLTNYQKLNGEFYSTALAIYLSRLNDVKVFFHTDDTPAREEFKLLFKHQQIGYIEDTADLLVLLSRISNKISPSVLDNALSDLASEYATEVTILEKKLKSYQMPAKDIRRMKFIKSKLDLLINKLSAHDFSGIGELYDFFKKNKSKCPQVYDHIDLHNEVFQLETTEGNNLIKKIKELRVELKTSPLLKLDNLIG